MLRSYETQESKFSQQAILINHYIKDILVIYQSGELFRVSHKNSEQSEKPHHTVPFKEVGL